MSAGPWEDFQAQDGPWKDFAPSTVVTKPAAPSQFSPAGTYAPAAEMIPQPGPTVTTGEPARGVMSRVGSAVEDTFKGPYGIQPGPAITSNPTAKTVFEHTVAPVTSGIDLAGRVPAAIGNAGAAAIAGTAEDLGMSRTKADDLERDVRGLTLAGGIASGGAPGNAGGATYRVKPSPLNPMFEFVSRVTGRDISKDKAALALVKRLEQDAKAGGPTAQEMIDLINTTPEKPLTVADVGGENTLALAGKVARTPGESRQIISKFLNERDLGAGPRLDADIIRALGDEKGADAYQALVKARGAAAKPLFDKAYEGGSIAPLEKQFEQSFDDASRAERDAAQEVNKALSSLTAAQAKKPVTGGNVYSESAANEAVKAAQQEVAAARARLTDAQTQKEQVLEMLHQAQEDVASGKKGAVWNPRIQQFLENPRIKEGIRRGFRIERDEALAEGRPMNPSEYAIVGKDEHGEPIVGKVPTMRLLATAKEGLDRMLQSDQYRNPLTGQLNKEGVALDKMRAQFIRELDAVNPDYAAARTQWSGDTQSLEAFRVGEKIFQANPRELREAVPKMTANDREFMRLGAARALRDAVARKGITGDEAKAIIRSQYTRDQLRPLFENDADYQRFINGVEAEGRMFGTRYSVLGNSKTASREIEDRTPELDSVVHAVRGTGEAAKGNFLGAASHLWNAVKGMASRGDAATNAEIARLQTADLSDPATLGRLRSLKTILDSIGPTIEPVPQAGGPYRYLVPALFGNPVTQIPTMTVRPDQGQKP